MATFPLSQEDLIALSKRLSKWLSYLEEKTKVRRVALPNVHLNERFLFSALHPLRIRSGRRCVRYARYRATSFSGTTDTELTKMDSSIFCCLWTDELS